MATGLALQALGLAWNAGVVDPAGGYSSIVGPFVISGIGMGMFFAPLANVILGSVRSDEEGKASGANNAIREMGGVLGVADTTGGSPRSASDGPLRQRDARRGRAGLLGRGQVR